MRDRSEAELIEDIIRLISRSCFSRTMGCRLFSMFFVAFEAISVVLDQYGESKRGFLLAAFLLSAFGFIITIYACIKKRTNGKRTPAAFRLQAAKRQLQWVEVVFSVVQLVTTFVQFILSVMRVKHNFNASLLPLAFAVLIAVFAFKKEKKPLIPQDEKESLLPL